MASDPQAEPSSTTPDPSSTPAAGGGLPDPLQILRSRGYVMLLVLAALVGIPIAAAAWGFLALIHVISNAAYETLPHALGYATVPTWWPIPVLFVAGVIIALAIKYLPGGGGHSPADGFSTGATEPVWLPGVIIAALAGISLGVVLGPEAPLIALGSGLAVFFMRRIKPDTPPTSQSVFAAAGSFAALGTIFGSPIIAAFFLMEAVGFGGTMMSTVLLPGLVASGVGSLIFVGLGQWSGLGTFSLSIPNLPVFAHPDVAQILWAVPVGILCALLGRGIKIGALRIREWGSFNIMISIPIAALVVAAISILFTHTAHHPSSDLLFSGQTLVGPLIDNASSWTVGALLLLVGLKSLAYSVSLGSFRGGPVFPSLLIGAAVGVLLSHLPGMGLVPGAAMGMGAMMVAILRMPLSSVMLATLLLFSDGLAVAPLVIVAVAVSHLLTARITPLPEPEIAPTGVAPAA
jgi:H+/Cl- antiporter ClcA